MRRVNQRAEEDEKRLRNSIQSRVVPREGRSAMNSDPLPKVFPATPLSSLSIDLIWHFLKGVESTQTHGLLACLAVACLRSLGPD